MMRPNARKDRTTIPTEENRIRDHDLGSDYYPRVCRSLVKKGPVLLCAGCISHCYRPGRIAAQLAYRSHDLCAGSHSHRRDPALDHHGTTSQPEIDLRI